MQSNPLRAGIGSKATQDVNWSSQRKPRALYGRTGALHSCEEYNPRMSCRKLWQPFLINEGAKEEDRVEKKSQRNRVQ